MKSRSSQSQPTPAPEGHRAIDRPAVDRRPVLSQVADLFARFRRKHPRGARVPKELRAAALAALEVGVAASDLYRSCGISWSQVTAWKASDIQAAAAIARPKPTRPKVAAATRRDLRRHVAAKDVRVFTVADPPPGLLAPGHELELRLGAWSVSVRLVDHGERR